MLVSVIIPVYNVERYLARCLDSVVSQSLQDIEIICIDDCSTDGSLSVLQEYQKRYECIHILENNENQGPSVARNKGIDASKGKYVFFLDSDDWIADNALEELTETAEKNVLDIVYFDSEMRFEDASAKKSLSGYKSKRTGRYEGVVSGKELLDAFSRENDYLLISCGALYRRKLLEENSLKFYTGILHEDNLFFIQAILLAKRVQCLNKVYYYYFRSMDTRSGKGNSIINLWSMVIIYSEIFRFLLKNNIEISDGIYQYNKRIFSSVTYLFRTVVNSRVELENLKFETLRQRNVFLSLLASFEPQQCRQLYLDDIAEMRKYSHLIVYGAGVIARRVVKMLIDYSLDNFHIAVTKPESREQYIGGCEVKSIETFLEWRDNSIVLVAVSAKYQNEILENLRSLGFSNYFCISDLN